MYQFCFYIQKYKWYLIIGILTLSVLLKIFKKTNHMTAVLIGTSDQMYFFLMNRRIINKLATFYSDNNITVSIPKCQCISFTRKKKPLSFCYKLNNTPLTRVEQVRDLGVCLDSKMSFNNHVDNIVKKSYRSLGFVLRTCKPFTDENSLKIVYYAYVRSTLEYACPIWYPIYAIHKDRIENIQKKFIRHLNFKTHAKSESYIESCGNYRVLTLEQRRKVLDMGLLWDVVRGRLDCPELVAQLALRVPARRTRHTPLFAVPLHHTNYGRNAVLTRILHTYNTEFCEVDPFMGNKKTFLKGISVAL